MPWIVTTRYSSVVKAFLDEFPGAVVELDGQIQTSAAIEWCTNAKLKSAFNFSLTQGDTVILSFHDGPKYLYAHDEKEAFVETLRAKKAFADRAAKGTLLYAIHHRDPHYHHSSCARVARVGARAGARERRWVCGATRFWTLVFARASTHARRYTCGASGS
jgi:hypothetical protein